ncbi:alpha/beta fold hydrolase [Aeromicrobium sp. CF3.5]|uniref:alpha/beta fold hydrolase n=1 Tax=Aeromicrobium sp. CF3.5 TaxID=3373078 RepID=UPI003EE617B7
MTRLTEYSRGPLTFDVIDSGPEDGEPVVLLHGFPQRATAWNQVSERLHAEGLRTYALDQRGYSPRARPTSRLDYRVSELVGDVVELIEQIGRPVHLVGHDWGAIVAWAVAGQHRDLIGTLTTVSVPHPGAFTRSMLNSSQGAKSWYMAMFQLPIVPERILGNRSSAEKFLRGGGMTAEMFDDYMTNIVEDGALRGGIGYYRSLPLSLSEGMGQMIRVPTTFVWSDRDAFLGRKGAENTRKWVTADYRFEVIEGGTHWLPERNADELAAAITARAASV